ncbi:hypothetical protein F8388_017641 [Cannabis sativa]|uniref:Uncharacterized protein n=1 Tax=Cannabis sativa TaxID=3483 RepID=A0A7J6DQY5_CANSA|nr:hypothetical protein F8388_007395 [Cannabis sativa]KAF4350257.1 hypothetical protein F8388_017641 [Cannabis sativa]KAF4393284.1 hypothetical protein G4B88_002018 [Cannabis sativa]
MAEQLFSAGRETLLYSASANLINDFTARSGSASVSRAQSIRALKSGGADSISGELVDTPITSFFLTLCDGGGFVDFESFDTTGGD